MAKPVKKSKAVDKWKLKKQFEVIAPDIFNNVTIGYVFAEEVESLTGRTVEATLSKLVNSNQHHIKVQFTITGTKGFTAQTMVKSVDISRAYLSSQANPGSDVIESVFRVKTRDGKDVVVKTIMFTKRKIHDEQKKALRRLTEESVNSSAEKLDYDRFVQEVVFGKIGSQIFNKGKKVVPLGRVEVRKMQLVVSK